MYTPNTNTNASYSDNTPHYNHALTIASNFTNNSKDINATIQIYSIAIQESLASHKFQEDKMHSQCFDQKDNGQFYFNQTS
jgi:hypothetical protein